MSACRKGGMILIFFRAKHVDTGPKCGRGHWRSEGSRKYASGRYQKDVRIVVWVGLCQDIHQSTYCSKYIACREQSGGYASSSSQSNVSVSFRYHVVSKHVVTCVSMPHEIAAAQGERHVRGEGSSLGASRWAHNSHDMRISSENCPNCWSHSDDCDALARSWRSPH